MKSLMIVAIALITIAGCDSLKQTPPADARTPGVFQDGDNAKSQRVDNLHQVRYIEMFLTGRDAKSGKFVAACYNSMFSSKGVPPSRDTAPQSLVEGLDLDQIQAEFGILNASLNGPKIWMPDWTEIEVGKEQVFNGMSTAWVAQLNMGENVGGVEATAPYTPQTIARKSALGWNKGTTVMLLDDAEGNTWILKGFQLGLKPKHTFDEFLAGGAAMFKKLPQGWGNVRVKVLERDLIETPVTGIATIMADEHFNVWDKTGPGMTNFVP